MRCYFALLYTLILLCCHNTYAQTYRIEHFSDKYYGTVTVSDTVEVFRPGTITVYERSANKPLISVSAEELAFDVQGDSTTANVKELPYGTQSLIQYEDFNFDGKKDFALMDGQNSCYHGPSFQVYLAEGDSFRNSAEFTRLTQEYCGMFTIDSEKKRLSTMTKSGCCWHQFSEFIVEDNKPKAIQIVESSLNEQLPFVVNTKVQNWDGKKMALQEKQYLSGDIADQAILFTFPLEGKNKTAILFQTDSTYLHYALLRADESIELIYPSETADKTQFTQTAKDHSLSFTNKDARYTISEDKSGIKIKVNTKGKLYTINGSRKGSKGSLASIAKLRLRNVTAK